MPRPVNAGQMRHRITLQKREAITSDYGVEEGVWRDVVSVAAHIEATANGVGGSEAVIHDNLTGTGFVTITLRKSSQTAGIMTGWRVKNARSDETYNIRQIRNEDGRDDFLTLSCQYGGNDG